jgi:protein-disulfide isomerase/uncharacterized membrane protein
MKYSPLAIVLLTTAVLLCGFGLAVSGVLLQHHVAAQIHSDPILGALCRAAATFDCDEVIASRWGKFEIPWGDGRVTVPTAALGLAFFGFNLAWFLVIGLPLGERRRMQWIPTVVCGLGLIGAAGFEYIMFYRLDKRCPLCMSTHAAMAVLFLVTLLLWIPGRNRPGEPAVAAGGEPKHPGFSVILSALLLAVAITGLGWYMYSSALSKGYAKEYFARWQDYERDSRRAYDAFLAQAPVDIPILPDDPVFGPADAKFTVVVFSDFLCPVCQALEVTVLEERQKEFPGQFRIVYKHFPLDKACNDAIPSTLHPGACAAAIAAEAVRLLKGNDAFWKMHRALFHNTGRFSTSFAYGEAEKLGIDKETYTKRIQTYSGWAVIRRNVAEGKKLGVDATPVMYFNNRLLKPWGDRHMWQYLLSEETLRAPAPPPSTATAPAEPLPSSRPVASGPS